MSDHSRRPAKPPSRGSDAYPTQSSRVPTSYKERDREGSRDRRDDPVDYETQSEYDDDDDDFLPARDHPDDLENPNILQERTPTTSLRKDPNYGRSAPLASRDSVRGQRDSRDDRDDRDDRNDRSDRNDRNDAGAVRDRATAPSIRKDSRQTKPSSRSDRRNRLSDALQDLNSTSIAFLAQNTDKSSSIPISIDFLRNNASLEEQSVEEWRQRAKIAVRNAKPEVARQLLQQAELIELWTTGDRRWLRGLILQEKDSLSWFMNQTFVRFVCYVDEEQEKGVLSSGRRRYMFEPWTKYAKDAWGMDILAGLPASQPQPSKIPTSSFKSSPDNSIEPRSSKEKQPLVQPSRGGDKGREKERTKSKSLQYEVEDERRGDGRERPEKNNYEYRKGSQESGTEPRITPAPVTQSELMRDFIAIREQKYKAARDFCFSNPSIFNDETHQMQAMAIECLRQEDERTAGQIVERLLMLKQAKEYSEARDFRLEYMHRLYLSRRAQEDLEARCKVVFEKLQEQASPTQSSSKNKSVPRTMEREVEKQTSIPLRPAKDSKRK